MSNINIQNISKSFTGDAKVIEDLSLEIKEGEFVVLLGPSGCGKTTLLRMIAGLYECDQGKIHIGDENVTTVPASKRGLAMVFQSYALYPHMTVRGNIAFGMKLAKIPKDKIEEKVMEVAKTLEIENLLDRKPRALSGGQRQRVAIGRAIARDPVAFLFDEPLSNLDAALRGQMRVELAHLHQRLKTTMIYVTHDQLEAMTLADKIVIMNQGNIEQVGKAMDLYHKPQNLFVAKFIGMPKMNVLDVTKLTSSHAEIGNGGNNRLKIDRKLKTAASRATHLGIRPEHIEIAAKTSADSIEGNIDIVEELGNDNFLYVKVDGIGLITIKASPEISYNFGDKVHLKINPKHVHLFDSAGDSLVHYS